MGSLLAKRGPKKAPQEEDPAGLAVSSPADRQRHADAAAGAGRAAGERDDGAAVHTSSRGAGNLAGSGAADTGSELDTQHVVVPDSRADSISASEKDVEKGIRATVNMEGLEDAKIDADNGSLFAGGSAGGTGLKPNAVVDSASTGDVKAATKASTLTRKTAGAQDGQLASQKAVIPGSRKAGVTAVNSDSENRARTQRRRGRPAGPQRTRTTVRILSELDRYVTVAHEQTDLGPQDIMDAALAEWLERNGYLDLTQAGLDVRTALMRVQARMGDVSA